MQLALSTRWNAFRHDNGESLADEILALGIKHIELGYDTWPTLVPGVQKRIHEGALHCISVHNYCPVPTGAPKGHPELYSLASLNPGERRLAVQYTAQTIAFAAEMGAGTVVTHAGNVRMRPLTPTLITLCLKGKQELPKYEKTIQKLFRRRSKYAQPHIAQLYRSLDDLIPHLEANKITLAIENLPSWEAIPTAQEMEDILEHFAAAPIRYWHDFGHARILQNLHLTPHYFTLHKFASHLAGMHIHDVEAPALDHIMPPLGSIPFPQFAGIANHTENLVIEPLPNTPACHIIDAVSYLTEAWSLE